MSALGRLCQDLFVVNQSVESEALQKQSVCLLIDCIGNSVGVMALKGAEMVDVMSAGGTMPQRRTHRAEAISYH